MSRNPLIEAIHEARYDLQTCAEKDKPATRNKLYDLLDQAASRTNRVHLTSTPGTPDLSGSIWQYHRPAA